MLLKESLKSDGKKNPPKSKKNMNNSLSSQIRDPCSIKFW